MRPLFALAVLSLAMAAASARAEVLVEVLAVTQVAVPANGDVFSIILHPLIASDGTAALPVNSETKVGQSVYAWRGSMLEPVAQPGDLAPGMPPGFLLQEATPIGFDDAGGLFYVGLAARPSDPERVLGGVWREDPLRGSELRVRAGRRGARFQDPIDVYSAVVGAGGHVALFQRDASDLRMRAPNGRWRTLARVARKVAFREEPEPFEDLASPHFLDGEGRGFFLGSAGSQGVWSARRVRDRTALVESQTPVPGAPPGTTFGGAGLHDVNAAGQVALDVTVFDEATGPESLQYCIMGPAGTTAALELLACNGWPAPGAPPGALFAGVSPTPTIDAIGRVVFTAWLEPGAGGIDPSQTMGIWRSDAADGLDLLVREGDAVPELPGATFAQIYDVAQGESGDVLFRAYLVGPGVDVTNAMAIFLLPPGGSPQLLMRSGDPLSVAPGDEAVVSGFSIALPTDLANRRSVGDGQAAILVHLEGGRTAAVRVSVTAP